MAKTTPAASHRDPMIRPSRSIAFVSIYTRVPPLVAQTSEDIIS